MEQKDVTYQIVCSNKDVSGGQIDVRADQWQYFNQWTNVYYSSSGVAKHLLGSTDDILLINGMYSWQYNMKPLLFAPAKRKIVSARGMLHSGALSQKAFKKKLFLELWKYFGLHHKVEFHAVNEFEEQAIRNVFGEKVKIHLASNLPRVFSEQSFPEKKINELYLVSIALVSPMKNILLVLQSLKEVREKINYLIYGPVKETVYWDQCKKVIQNLPPNITVQYKGDLHPSSVEEALQEGQVFILPSKSENFGHALYEALTAGKPVITSHYTPWNELERARAGLNVSTENETAITDAVRFFAAMDKTDLETWSRGARAYAERVIDVDAIKEQYRQMFGLRSDQQHLVAVEQKRNGQ